jgi:glycosyltransferase involved in cell wall biosynthesis
VADPAVSTLPKANADQVPLVSIIVSFLDPGAFLREAVESVLRQDFHDWELALVDDGSTDESAAFARDCAASHPDRIRYVEHPRHENRGVAASRNVGLGVTRGQLIALLDADDVWPPGRLSHQVPVMGEHPEVDWIFGPGVYWYGWTGNPDDRERDYVQPMASAPGSVATPSDFLPRMIREPDLAPCPGAMLLRRSAVERVGGFEESFTGAAMHLEDLAFSTKLAATCRAINTGAVSLLYRQHPRSLCNLASARGTYRATYRAYLEWLFRFLADHDVPGSDSAAHEAWQRNFGPLATVRAGLVRAIPSRLRPAFRRLKEAWARHPGGGP